MPLVRAVDALAAIRSSRFDLPLTYDAGDLDLHIGDVVQIAIGSREHVAYVVSAPRQIESERPLRPVHVATGVPRAFDEIGLALAQFIAERYLCTLGEALSAVVLSSALPRTIDTFMPAGERPKPKGAVPARLIALIWNDLADGFALEQLLRHPEARRAGDRASLLRAVNALVRSGNLRRERRFVQPRAHEYQVKILIPGPGTVKGRKAEALVNFVRDRGEVPRSEAILAGFSNAIIARAVKAHAVLEEEVAAPKGRVREAIPATIFAPTTAQGAALESLERKIDAGIFAELLLYGITGSGKTFVYIEAMKRVLQRGGRAIVLVPEISLTPQIARRFEEVFGGRVAVLHSALSERERFDAWQASARGEVEIVLGARSAVFAPLRNVRLIVVDEAHEPSYKQDVVPRYHAVTVARERARLEGAVLVLGSATPPLESYADVRAGRAELIELPLRATGQALPEVDIVDMTAEFEAGNRRMFSSRLAQALGDRLDRGEKSVLFLNRRGTAGFLLCRSCGMVPQCRRCSVSLTVHRSEGLLRCHYCDAQRRIPRTCDTCGSDAIKEFGIGTQRVVEEVERLYPKACVVRMDADNTTRIGDHARLLDEFDSKGDVLVGTQMVAKGLDFPAVTLVGVVAADISLHVADFRAAERTFDLIAQVCGRSGRGSPGEAIVQTYAPAHPAIRLAAAQDYRAFAQREYKERKATGFPPAAALIYLGVMSRNRAHALAQSQQYADILKKSGAGDVLGPAPFAIARLNEEWRFRVAFKGADGAALRSVVRERILPIARSEHTTRLAVNVDP